jgi:hypothetical protein
VDPNANLAEQLELAERIMDDPGRSDMTATWPISLAELVLALDEWIRGGAFLPDAWKK